MTKKNNNKWPIYCQGICCLGRFILVFIFTLSLALKTRTQTRKRLVTTPGRDACLPLQSATLHFDAPARTKRRPSTITHTETHRFHSEKVQRASPRSRREGKQLLNVGSYCGSRICGVLFPKKKKRKRKKKTPSIIDWNNINWDMEDLKGQKI